MTPKEGIGNFRSDGMNALYFIVTVTNIISLKVCKIVRWKNSSNGISIVMTHGAPSYSRPSTSAAANLLKDIFDNLVYKTKNLKLLLETVSGE